MMHVLGRGLCAGALASIVCAAGAGGAERPLEKPESLSMVWFDSYGLCPLARRIAEAESESILKGMGISAVIESPLAQDRAEAPIRFRVAVLDAKPTAWGLEPDALGAAVLGGAHPGVVFVFAENLIRTAGYKPGPDGCRYARREREIGRAVARIAIHEIVHAVAPEHPHAEAGLMAGRISRQWLLEPLNGFDRNCERAFVSRLKAAVSELPISQNR